MPESLSQHRRRLGFCARCWTLSTSYYCPPHALDNLLSTRQAAYRARIKLKRTHARKVIEALTLGEPIPELGEPEPLPPSYKHAYRFNSATYRPYKRKKASQKPHRCDKRVLVANGRYFTRAVACKRVKPTDIVVKGCEAHRRPRQRERT